MHAAITSPKDGSRRGGYKPPAVCIQSRTYLVRSWQHANRFTEDSVLTPQPSTVSQVVGSNPFRF